MTLLPTLFNQNDNARSIKCAPLVSSTQLVKMTVQAFHQILTEPPRKVKAKSD